MRPRAISRGCDDQTSFLSSGLLLKEEVHLVQMRLCSSLTGMLVCLPIYWARALRRPHQRQQGLPPSNLGTQAVAWGSVLCLLSLPTAAIPQPGSVFICSSLETSQSQPFPSAYLLSPQGGNAGRMAPLGFSHPGLDALILSHGRLAWQTHGSSMFSLCFSISSQLLSVKFIFCSIRTFSFEDVIASVMFPQTLCPIIDNLYPSFYPCQSYCSVELEVQTTLT